MRQALLITFVILAICGKAQTLLNTDTCGSSSKTENIYSYPAYGDSLCSSFVITIKKKVAAHKHVFHSEHVLVLEGKGEMLLGSSVITIKKGDLVFIPKNIVHAVTTTGNKPLKVVSIQAPRFDGTDRVMEGGSQ
jgi:mannose-6-phosphate isomerase-like protein (cupin superfamily)